MSNFPNVVATALPLNPEPWAMGNVSAFKIKGRAIPKVAPNLTLKNYQEALRAELGLTDFEILPGPYYSVRFTFSRQLVKYKTSSGRTSTRNWADVTNMQKGTEDALQGVAFGNDRDVIRVESRLFGTQSASALPFVVIEIRHSIEGYSPEDTAICYTTESFSPAGQAAWEKMIQDELGPQDITDNEWTP